MVDALCSLVAEARGALGLAAGAPATVGVGTPGTLTAQGLVKNANTQCLNGQPLLRDLQARLGPAVAMVEAASRPSKAREEASFMVCDLRAARAAQQGGMKWR